MNIRSDSSDSCHLFQVFGSLGLRGIEEFSGKIEEAIVSDREHRIDSVILCGYGVAV